MTRARRHLVSKNILSTPDIVLNLDSVRGWGLLHSPTWEQIPKRLASLARKQCRRSLCRVRLISCASINLCNLARRRKLQESRVRYRDTVKHALPPIDRVFREANKLQCMSIVVRQWQYQYSSISDSDAYSETERVSSYSATTSRIAYLIMGAAGRTFGPKISSSSCAGARSCSTRV